MTCWEQWQYIMRKATIGVWWQSASSKLRYPAWVTNPLRLGCANRSWENICLKIYLFEILNNIWKCLGTCWGRKLLRSTLAGFPGKKIESGLFFSRQTCRVLTMPIPGRVSVSHLKRTFSFSRPKASRSAHSLSWGTWVYSKWVQIRTKLFLFAHRNFHPTHLQLS